MSRTAPELGEGSLNFIISGDILFKMNSTIRKYSFLLGACLSVYSCIHGGGLAPEWVKDMFVPHIENGFPYRIMSPMDGTDQEKFPVIISLHRDTCGGSGARRWWRRVPFERLEFNQIHLLENFWSSYPIDVQ